MPSSLSAVSIIVPTFREAPNIRPLVERVFAAMNQMDRGAELILVDDNSKDGSEAIAEALSERYPVRLIVRREARGLSSAVLTGFQEARFDRFVVLDADLQHPPEVIPTMLDRLDQGSCDFVIGTRYSGEGTIVEQWPLLRRIGSSVATLLARPLMPVSDPMSGFFALHRGVWERAEALNPIGYKIALELYVKCRCAKPAEVPIHFATRAAGKSKLTFGEQVRYLLHLGRLYRFRFPLLTGVLLFVMVAGAGTIALLAVRALW